MDGDLTPMQNRYVGGIGDYLKLGILRALSPGYRLGVAWWLYPDESHNRDGRHIGYLQRPERWRHYDRMLFDALAGIVSSNQRHVPTLEAANLLPDALFASEMIPTDGPLSERRRARNKWFDRMKATLADADRCSWTRITALSPLASATVSREQARACCSVSYRNWHVQGDA